MGCAFDDLVGLQAASRSDDGIILARFLAHLECYALGVRPTTERPSALIEGIEGHRVGLSGCGEEGFCDLGFAHDFEVALHEAADLKAAISGRWNQDRLAALLLDAKLAVFAAVGELHR